QLFDLVAPSETPLRGQPPFVGRGRELARLAQAFEDAGLERRCYLFTLLGSAGMGKSRLVAEFSARIADQASVVRGRCLPYGEGITYWPIGEIVRAMGETSESDDAAAVVERLSGLVADAPEGARIAHLVAGAVGLVDQPASAEETFWGIRSWLEAQARKRPLVCIIEDVHWAESTLLDLLEHVADWTRDAPILLLCTARPELLEIRPTWAGGKLNATTLMLEPLSSEQTSELVASLLSKNELPAGVVSRVLETAEGNPLFAEEIVRMLVDDALAGASADPRATAGGGVLDTVAMPTSVQAVIAARLDRLPTRERMVAERAAVAGRVFERGAVTALVPDAERATLGDDLRALVRKELVHPDRPELTTDDAFRFRHLLIRDTAYEALPKQERAELHERFAAWVEGVVGDRAGEYEEIIGYHYEQAHRYRRELGIADERSARLAEQAAVKLADAGTRAYRRRDHVGAAKLLSRAIALMPAGTERRAARLTLAIAHLETFAHDEAGPVIAALLKEAEAAGDVAMAWKARLLDHTTRSWSDPDIQIEAAEPLVAQALPVFEAAGDDYGLMLAHHTLAELHLAHAHWEQAMAEYALAIPHAARSDPVLEDTMRADLVAAAFFGPTPVPDLLRIADSEMGRMHSPHALTQGIVALARAMAGDADRALEEVRAALARRTELVGADRAVVFTSGFVEYVVGDLDAAEAALRRNSDALAAGGETGARSTVEGLLALTLFDLGRANADVLAATELCRTLTAEGDAVSQVLWRESAALVAGRAGQFDEARALIAAAIERVDRTDFLYLRGVASRDRGRIAEMAGEAAPARAAYATALDYFEQKGDVVDAKRMRDALARLGSA
ncbi:MAG TPA: AAA family ATPase, partial [Candidatus Limnocylindrales bacterium]|nr:AAA family ATPase [Candidatus Limnocylindrales bacterium]